MEDCTQTNDITSSVTSHSFHSISEGIRKCLDSSKTSWFQCEISKLSLLQRALPGQWDVCHHRHIDSSSAHRDRLPEVIQYPDSDRQLWCHHRPDLPHHLQEGLQDLRPPPQMWQSSLPQARPDAAQGPLHPGALPWGPELIHTPPAAGHPPHTSLGQAVHQPENARGPAPGHLLHHPGWGLQAAPLPLRRQACTPHRGYSEMHRRSEAAPDHTQRDFPCLHSAACCQSTGQTPRSVLSFYKSWGIYTPSTHMQAEVRVAILCTVEQWLLMIILWFLKIMHNVLGDSQGSFDMDKTLTYYYSLLWMQTTSLNVCW